MTELTDRMRTCAAYLGSKAIDDLPNEVIEEAAKLLVEAADELGLYDMQNPPATDLPMEIIPPSEAARVAPEKTVRERLIVSDLSGAAWIDPGVPDLPTQPLSRNACPNCDSRAAKTVRALGKTLELECPVCGTRWQR